MMFVSFNSKRMTVACGTGTANPSGAPEFTLGFSRICVARSFIFCVMFCKSLFILLSFFFWSLCCRAFFDSRLLITSLVSCGQCVVWPSSIHGFWLPLWYLVAIVLSGLLRFTTSDYPFGILWPLCCLFFFDSRLLITPLVSCGHCVV